MKLIKSILILVALSSAAPAHSREIDLGAMKCAQYLQMSKEESATVVTWLVGFYTEVADPKTIDLARLTDVGAKFSAFCTQNPSFGLITAADGILGN